ncbi:MAG: glycosyltransferase family 39 protein [Nitrospirae bacterium]|nr:MAG: glycosyltransferase family 39 protein [Nitrospirota bacterium]
MRSPHDPNDSMTTTDRSPHALLLLALLALSGLLFFLALGDMGLTDRDEGRNAEAGREMFESGDRLTPTFNGELRIAKPVFIYWLMEQSYRLFGVNEFAARFPSALFGVGLIFIHYLFLVHQRDQTVALFGGLMLLLNLEILGLGRMALTDSVLIFFTTASLYGFWLGLHGEGGVRRWIWAFYIGMALATLTKGPVGFAVPIIAAALYLTWTRRWRDYWQKGVPLAGLLLFILLAAPWYAAMFLVHGDAYATGAKANTIGRFLSPMEGHQGTIFFYLPVLLLGFFPWSALLPVPLYHAFKNWRSSGGISRYPSAPLPHSDLPQPSTPGRELELFAALWVVGVFVFFTASSTRLPHYIGPLFPAAALLTASYWSRCLQDPTTKGIRGSIHLMMGLGYLLAVGFACLPTLYATYASKMVREFPLAGQVDLGSSPYLAATVLLLGMTLVGYLGLYDERRGGAFWAAGATLASLVLIVIVIATPHINRYVIAPPQELAYAAGLNLSRQDQFIAYGTTRPSSVFYAKRKTLFVPIGEEDRIRTALIEPKRVMILLPESAQSKLPAEANGLVPILKRYGYVLLANQPMVMIPEGATPPPPPTTLGH